MTASRALTDLMDRRPKRLAGGEPAAHHGRAVGPNYDTMSGPAGSGQIERGGADVRLQLSGSTAVVEPERLGVDRPAPNKNGQATPGPAVLIESRVNVYHETLSQALPTSRLTNFWRV
jgi:hypothetical protein